MYKHFQAGNAKTICDQLNESKMKIHSIEMTNGMFYCIGEPCDDSRPLKSLGGSVLIVTTNLNKYKREIEGKVLMRGHSATAFYRYDESKESSIQDYLDKEEKAKAEAAIKAEKEAKKAEMKKKMEELKKAMESVESEMSDSQKEEEEKKKKEAELEAKRQEELKKEKKKKEEAKKESEAKKEPESKKKSESKDKK